MADVEVVLKALVAIDDGAADVLVRSALADALDDAHAAWADAVADEVSQWQAEAIPVVKREFVRGYVEQVSKGTYPTQEWVDGQMALLEAIEKAQEQWVIDGRSTTVDVMRDNKGRFSRSTSNARASLASFDAQPAQNLSSRPAGKLVAPKNLSQYVERTPQGELIMRSNQSEDSKANAERYLGAYKEAQRLQDELKSVFGNDAKHVRLVQQIDDITNQTSRLESVDLDGIPATWDPETEQQSRLLFDADASAPDDVKSKVANANAAGAVLGTTGMRAVGSPEEMRAVLGALSPSKGQQAPSERRYNQMAAMGNMLNRVAPGSSAARYLQAAGAWGKDTQDALGPYVERAAYRFRGNEVRPDEGLLNVFNSEDMKAKDAEVGADDSKRMGVRRQVAGQVLLEKIPTDRNLVELATRSGNSLPSQGVLIDADGDIVSQSVGVGPDHYVPFDLKTMKALNGGQYVRTRVLGGLTPEDIHAVLVGNGRAASVVSGSGRFELELDPDLRGKRRFNDKVMVMADRYERILDAVADSGMYVQDLPADVQAQARERAAMVAGSTSGDAYDKALTKEQDRRRAELSQVTTAEREQVVAEVEQQMAGTPGSAQQKAAARNDAIEERLEALQAQKVRQLKLNHEGYALALRTLQQQFPHAIRSVRADTLEDFAPKKGAERMQRFRSRKYATDAGYVGPMSGNRPRSEADAKRRGAGGEERWRYYESQRGQREAPKETKPAATSAAGGEQTTETAATGAAGTQKVGTDTALGAALEQRRRTAAPKAGGFLASWMGKATTQFDPTKDTVFSNMAAGGGQQSVKNFTTNPGGMARLLLAQGTDTERGAQLVAEIGASPEAQAMMTPPASGGASPLAEAMVKQIVSLYESSDIDDKKALEALTGQEGTNDELLPVALAQTQEQLDTLRGLAQAVTATSWASPDTDPLKNPNGPPIAFPEVMGLTNEQGADALLGDTAVRNALAVHQITEPSSQAISAALTELATKSKALTAERGELIATSGKDDLTDDEKKVIAAVTGRPPDQAFNALRMNDFGAALESHARALQLARSAALAKEALGGGANPKVREVLAKRAAPVAPSRRLAGLPVLSSDDPRTEAVRKGLETGVLRLRRRRSSTLPR